MRVAVVTGGNKGIGLAIVKGLCQKFEGDVFLTARDVKRGQNAVEELNKLGLKSKFHQLDITNQESINTMRDFLKENYGGLDLLVNNAAIAYKMAATEPFSEQAENTLKVNYFSVLATCKTLFPLLRPHARVVNVSSSAGHLHRIPSEELRKKLASPTLTEEELSLLMNQFIQSAKRGTNKADGWGESTYCVSKVGLSALTFIQHRDFMKDSREDIVINAVHPGYVSTDMTSYKGPLSVEEGAAAPLFLALLPPGTTEPRGCYVWYDKQIVDWVNGPMPGQY